VDVLLEPNPDFQANAEAPLAMASLSRDYGLNTDAFCCVASAAVFGTARKQRGWRPSLAKITRLTLCRPFGYAAALIAVLCSIPHAHAQNDTPPPQGVSRGENFSAKPPAQLFASDCTGSGCHKSPQGLGRTQGFGSLAGFLREHYTNSRESAAALANYLSKLPSGPEPREARTPKGKPAAASSASGGPTWLEGEGKPPSQEGRASRQSATGRASRAAVKPEEEPANVHQQPAGEPVEATAKSEAPPKPEAPAKPSARERRGHQPATAAVQPPPQPEPEAAPPPPAPAPPPKPKQYDIFD